jgi:hypothetical protein
MTDLVDTVQLHASVEDKIHEPMWRDGEESNFHSLSRYRSSAFACLGLLQS